MIRSFFGKEAGQGAPPYALTLAVIAIIVILVLTLIGSKIPKKDC